MHNVFANRVRAVVAIGGLSFAVLMIFLQLGFLGAVVWTADALVGRLDHDLAIVAADYRLDFNAGTVARARREQVEGIAGVERVTPIWTGTLPWQNPVTKERLKMAVIGIDPSDVPLRLPGLPPVGPLTLPDVVFIDSESRPACGPQLPGTRAIIGERTVEIADSFPFGIGFVADGTILVSDQTFVRLFGESAMSWMSFGLVHLEPGADAAVVQRGIAASLPADVRVLSRQELARVQRHVWVDLTAMGNIFTTGTAVAFVVGLAILYQILSTDITTHLPEYATLKAMGYDTRRLVRIVLEQATVYAILGYIPALLLSFGVYRLCRAAAGIPMEMSFGRALFVLTLTLVLCWGSALVSFRRVQSADPAELFK